MTWGVRRTVLEEGDPLPCHRSAILTSDSRGMFLDVWWYDFIDEEEDG